MIYFLTSNDCIPFEVCTCTTYNPSGISGVASETGILGTSRVDVWHINLPSMLKRLITASSSWAYPECWILMISLNGFGAAQMVVVESVINCRSFLSIGIGSE